MDHNGFYAELDSLTSIGTNSSSFSDTACSALPLPSLNNYKYPQSTSNNNIYQQQAIPDLNQQHHSIKSTSSTTTTLPQTQININNCNNNIFFPHDDGLGFAVDATQAAAAASCASTTNIPQQQQQQQQNSSSINSSKSNNNFIGYVHRKEPSVVGGIGGGSGDSNITYNINNINTNIVNNINNNPTNLVNSGDIFGGNQYHQISKNGETIINFTNNNLNATTSMPTDNVTATSQNFYGYQATNLNSSSNNNNQGQQQQHQQHTLYESSVQSSSTSQLIDMGATKSMGSATAVPPSASNVYHHHSNGGGSYGATESLSAAKIINTFESKNPLKYSTTGNRTGAGGGATYFKSGSDYPQYHQPPVNHLPPPHATNYIYQPSNSMPPKISPSYDIYGHPPRLAPPTTRNTVPHYPPYGAPTIVDDQRVNYARNSHPQYHHIPPPPPHHNNYGNYYNNGNYNHPMPPQYPQYYASGGGGTMRNDSCAKAAPNYSKTGAMALSPVDHGSFQLPPSFASAKKDFYTSDNHYYPAAYHPETLNSCAKKSTSGSSALKSDVYTPNLPYDPLHHHHHHAMNGNVMRNASYQPIKHFNTNGGFAMPTNEGLSSCDYQSYNYRYKNGDMSQKLAPKNPMMSGKQFKTYNHYEPVHPPAQFPPHHYGPPQYHTMVKHPDKIKISIDLEEQINSSKIPKMTPSYGYDLHYSQHPSYYSYHRPPRNSMLGQNESDKITNINISLRDFLSTWNEIDDDDESRPQQTARLEELGSMEHIERTIMREYNPMFVQKATDNLINSNDIQHNDKSQMELENSAISEGTEKLYVLETIDVPISELNKYKHLSIINKLPENVVITDKELFTDMEMNREKLYKSEFELEFEACQQGHNKIGKDDECDIPTVEIKSESDEEEDRKRAAAVVNEKIKEEELKEQTVEVKEIKIESKEKKEQVKVKKEPKIKQAQILKLKKEKILKDPKKSRIAAKRVRKYSLNQKTSETVKKLQSICIDFLNTSTYRNYAREQLSISKKFSKMKVLKDFKKKFNFDSMKKPASSLINQKSNHSVRVNSLREMCGKLLVDKSKLLELDGSEESEFYQQQSCVEVPTLKELCTSVLAEMNVSIVESYTPPTLVDICENFIYANRQYFHIEEVSNVPKLQDMCKEILSDPNLFNILTLNEQNSTESNVDNEPIYIVEDNSGNVGDLFESDTLNPQEKSEILRKIQQIDEDDEIIRAIGALHDDDDNNNSNLYNKNIQDDLSYIPFTSNDDDELVQYEEIISVNNRTCDGKIKKVVEILRHKYLNRCEVRQATKTINRIVRRSLDYMRVRRFRDSKRKERINALVQQARCALLKLRQLNCENSEDIPIASPAPSTSSSSSSSSSCSSSSSSSTSSSSSSSSSSSEENDNSQDAIPPPVVLEPKNESQNNAKVNRESPQSPLIVSNHRTEVTNSNFPKMPIAFPSINEYRIEQKTNNRGTAAIFPPSNKRKMSFDESLLHINKMYKKRNENGEDIRNHERKYRNDDRRMSVSSSSRYHSRNHYDDRHRRQQHSRTKSRSRSRSRSKSRHRSRNDHLPRRNNNSNNNNYHNSSSRYDHDHYRKDQNNSRHSEARRLVLPRYKLYDKDLDVKLKVRPIVRIEREERVDDLVKKYN